MLREFPISTFVEKITNHDNTKSRMCPIPRWQWDFAAFTLQWFYDFDVGPNYRSKHVWLDGAFTLPWLSEGTLYSLIFAWTDSGFKTYSATTLQRFPVPSISLPRYPLLP
jgi:hypothetical protein